MAPASPNDRAVIRFRDPIDAAGDTAAPNVVLEDSRLSAQVRMTYIVLRKLAYQDQDRPIYRRDIARHVGVSVRQVARHLAELQASRLIQIDSGQRDGLPNYYWIEDLAVRYGDLSRSNNAGRAARYRLGPSTVAAKPRDTSVPPTRDADVSSPKTPVSRNKHHQAVVADPQQHGEADPALADRLADLGVHADVAARLAITYSAETITAVLAALRRRQPPPRDPAAWTVAAIRGGWIKPRRPAATNRERTALSPQPAIDDSAIIAFERHADATLDGLQPAERQHLEQRATEIVRQRFGHRITKSNVGAGLIRTELRRLVAARLRIPVPELTEPAPSPRDG